MIDSVILRHGVISVRELESLGMRRSQREAAIASGRLVRVRTGWLARPDADADVVAAVRRRGCVACGSALRLRGVWVPEGLDRRHVRTSRRNDEWRPDGCRVYGPARPVVSAIDDVATAFRSVLRCGSSEDIVVIADSLLHLGLATRDDLAAWSADAPLRTRALMATVDLAESGTESMTRIRLRRRRIRVRTQVWIGRRRVDLVVGDLLIIECDGAEHHSSWQAQSSDRERDRALTAQGYLVVRLTYRQIVHDWPRVERDLLAIIRRGGHCRPRRTR